MPTPNRIDPALLAATSFSPTEIAKLRSIYERRHGVVLTDDQASRYGRALLLYVAVVCRIGRRPRGAAGLDESATEVN